MTPEERTLVQYRLARAREALDEAALLFDAGHLHTYVNRLYYACFYAMSALLLARGLSTSRHSHLRGLLHKEFVHPGLIPIDRGQFFDLLYNSRQLGYDCGSGPIESLCGRLTDRLKGPGMRWDKSNAEAMMALASLYHSDLWATYWKSERTAA